LIDNLAQGSQEMTSALATRRLDQLLNLLETHPQSLLFGKPSASPGPGEPGFAPPQPIK